MHCVKCGSPVPDNAGFCPSCGAPAISSVGSPVVPTTNPSPQSINTTKTGPGCLKMGLIILAVFVVLGVIGSLLPKQPPVQTVTSETSSTAVESAEDLPLAVTAKQLFEAYESNEASAQSYFGKRKLLVSGTVEKVALDIMDDPEILLRTPNQFMSAHAALADEAKNQAGQYSPGDAVKLLCNDVSEVASIPMLKKCIPAPKDQKSQPIKWSKK